MTEISEFLFAGIGAPRLGVGNQPLPSARSISKLMFKNITRPSAVYTMMHMTFGQLLAHDLLLTPVTMSEDGEGNDVPVACGDGCSTTGPENQECFPITVEPDDLDFSGLECLKLVRSEQGFNDDCSNS